MAEWTIRAHWSTVSAYWPMSWSGAAHARRSDQIAAANTIDVQTRVVKYQPLYSRVKAVDGGVTLQFASLSINAGADHEAAMRFVSRSPSRFESAICPACCRNSRQIWPER